MRSRNERALSAAEVDEIRARLVDGEFVTEIAGEYGLHQNTVSKAVRGANAYAGVGSYPIPVYRPWKPGWELPDVEARRIARGYTSDSKARPKPQPEHTPECHLCGGGVDPSDDDSVGLYCSELCASYGSEGDHRFSGLDDRPRELLIQINDHPDDHTEALVELHDTHQMSPNRLAQHTPYGDCRIRELLRSEGVYQGVSQPKTEPDFRARYEDPDFTPDRLGLSPIGEAAEGAD